MGCDLGVGPTQELSLRVSVASLARVLFRHPEDGELMLVLERKATLIEEGDEAFVEVMSQPFGGAVRIRDPAALQELIGEFHFDSERSCAEMDFRIFIDPADWLALKQFSIQHLQNKDDPVLDADPGRELIEEFLDCLGQRITRELFINTPVGIRVEEEPAPTENTRARGFPTVRVYRLFETQLSDQGLGQMIIIESNRVSDKDLADFARLDKQNGGKGRANGVLALPLNKIIEFYAQTPLQERSTPVGFEEHQLAETVPAVLNEIAVPKYQRL